MNPSANVVAVFCLAGLLSSLAYTSYSAWTDSLNRANSEIHRSSLDDPSSRNYDPVKAQRLWYAENIRLTAYYDRKWPIFCLSFPVAITAALLIAIGFGWLPRVFYSRMLVALIPVYLAPVLVLWLYAVSWSALLIPALALAAYLLRWSVEIFTSRRPRRFVVTLLIASLLSALLALAAGFAVGAKNGETLAAATFLIAMEMMAAGLYAKSLTPPPVAPPMEM